MSTVVQYVKEAGGHRPGQLATVIDSVAERLIAKGVVVRIEPRPTVDREE